MTGAAETDSGDASTLTPSKSSLWTMTGNSNLTNLTNEGSAIIFTAPTGDPTRLASYKTLTAVNYLGLLGTIQLNTYLGADGAPSDRLVIDGGTATGRTTLDIRNTIGPGARTRASGILVVQTLDGATTTRGAFALAGEVRAGLFNYCLFRGGINGASPQDWFLRNSFVVPPIPPIPPRPPFRRRAARAMRNGAARLEARP